MGIIGTQGDCFGAQKTAPCIRKPCSLSSTGQRSVLQAGGRDVRSVAADIKSADFMSADFMSAGADETFALSGSSPTPGGAVFAIFHNDAQFFEPVANPVGERPEFLLTGFVAHFKQQVDERFHLGRGGFLFQA